jgi:hypothetical protein
MKAVLKGGHPTPVATGDVGDVVVVFWRTDPALRPSMIEANAMLGTLLLALVTTVALEPATPYFSAPTPADTPTLPVAGPGPIAEASAATWTAHPYPSALAGGAATAAAADDAQVAGLDLLLKAIVLNEDQGAPRARPAGHLQIGEPPRYHGVTETPPTTNNELRWKVQIRVTQGSSRKLKHFGVFGCQLNAARAYDMQAHVLNDAGRNPRLPINFPDADAPQRYGWYNAIEASRICRPNGMDVTR